ncbi:DUF1330 domain-containing protein [Arthrobacter sp. SD76]|uniref:DUF1330 domain-containing protein n=1 Tax=Arthrobacter sp. SD76 TaxID=3415007 RepID=UPI003C753BE2
MDTKNHFVFVGNRSRQCRASGTKPFRPISDLQESHLPRPALTTKIVVSHRTSAGRITDQAAYDAYRMETPRLLAQYGARCIVAGAGEEIVEGDLASARFTILEFPSMSSLRDFWESDDYANVRAIRKGAVDLRIGFLDGFSPV